MKMVDRKRRGYDNDTAARIDDSVTEKKDRTASQRERTEQRHSRRGQNSVTAGEDRTASQHERTEQRHSGRG